MFDVVIVGAGLSGLMAANELARKRPGARICILEARSRIGGRTETLPDCQVDVGAQWVGPEHAKMLELIGRFNLQLVDQFYPPSSSATRLTECVGYEQQALSAHDKSMVDAYIELIENLSLELDVNQPWAHANAAVWDEMSVSQHIMASVPESTPAQHELLLFAQTVFACVPANTSFLFFLFCLASGGGMKALGDGELGAQKWKILGGVDKLCGALLRDCGHQVELKLNSVVEHILDAAGHTRLLLRNGEEVCGRRVILALSPLLIKRIQFTPPLPSERIALQNAMVSGRAIKIILGYKTAFWLQASKAASTSPTSTTIVAHNLFDSHKVMGKPALVGLITGATAMALEPLSVEERRALVETQIREMYQHKEAGSEFYLERVWGLEEFSGGCFAGLFPPNAGFAKLGVWLRRPIPAARLHFASTETTAKYYGYMEGALLAGARAVSEVLELWEDSLE